MPASQPAPTFGRREGSCWRRGQLPAVKGLADAAGCLHRGRRTQALLLLLLLLGSGRRQRRAGGRCLLRIPISMLFHHSFSKHGEVPLPGLPTQTVLKGARCRAGCPQRGTAHEVKHNA